MKSALQTVVPLAMPFDRRLSMPGSKSHANRAIIAACLSSGTTLIEGATPCDDVAILVENLQKMGFRLIWKDKDSGTLEINGGLPDVKRDLKPITLFCENAGTTLRFLTTLACLLPGEWIITGNDHMLKRPIGALTEALKHLGATIEDAGGFPPLHIKGGTLHGGTVTLDASKSSQFLTSLLLTAPALPAGLTVTLPGTIASAGYLALTLQVLRDFGVTTEKDEQTYTLKNQSYTSPGRYRIEGDWSAAGAWLIIATLTNSRLQFDNLSLSSRQSDRFLLSVIEKLREPNDLIIDCCDIPDQVMNIVALASSRPYVTTLVGAANLRLKECNRLAVTVQEFSRLGISVKEEPDGLRIQGATRETSIDLTNKPPITLDPHDDHRMAMAFAIIGSSRCPVIIKNPACVSKSYPLFFKDLETIRHAPRCLAIVGMRGTGKTNLAERLGRKLHLPVTDTDQLYQKCHGPIADTVANHGWPAFREEEERIVKECLQPGHIVSLGGGAIESASTRDHLQKKAIVIWLKADQARILKHLQQSKLKRPALTALPVADEIAQKLSERDPLYESVASITLPQTINYKKQIPVIIKSLQKLCLS